MSLTVPIPIWEVSTAALGVRNSSVEAHARFGSLLRRRPATLVVTELTTIRLQTDGSTSFVQHSLPGISAYATKKNDCATREPERDYYVFMTALVDFRWAIRKEILVQQLAQWRFQFAGPNIRLRAECLVSSPLI